MYSRWFFASLSTRLSAVLLKKLSRRIFFRYISWIEIRIQASIIVFSHFAVFGIFAGFYALWHNVS